MAPDSPTEKKVHARCGIYDQRPQICRDYPKIDQYIPEECTFLFIGDKRSGGCDCNVGACCNTPRQDGEPGGAPLPAIAGGKACKHLVWEADPSPEKRFLGEVLEKTMEKAAFDLHDLVRGPSDS